MFKMLTNEKHRFNMLTMILVVSLISGFAIHGYLTKPNDSGRYQIISPSNSGVIIISDSATGNSWVKSIRGDFLTSNGLLIHFPMNSNLNPKKFFHLKSG
jgi:hypothetical protein